MDDIWVDDVLNCGVDPRSVLTQTLTLILALSDVDLRSF